MTSLICIATILVNLSQEPWNDLDAKSIGSAKVTCEKRYDGCLVKFVKKEPRMYQAICGN